MPQKLGKSTCHALTQRTKAIHSKVILSKTFPEATQHSQIREHLTCEMLNEDDMSLSSCQMIMYNAFGCSSVPVVWLIGERSRPDHVMRGAASRFRALTAMRFKIAHKFFYVPFFETCLHNVDSGYSSRHRHVSSGTLGAPVALAVIKSNAGKLQSQTII